MTCPHCGAPDVDRGATGLDVCTRCGGLSRDGQPLRREQPFCNFALPKLVDLNYIPAAGVHVAAVLMEDGGTGIAVTYVMGDGKSLPALVVAGEVAASFGRLVADALDATQRRQN